MKHLLALALLALACTVRADEFTGHYELTKPTKAPFSLDVQQAGKTATVSFSAGRVDGSGAAPDGDGYGKLNARGALELTWTDSFDNTGTATLRRDGKGFRLSMKTEKVTDPRAIVFYGEIVLKRTSTTPQTNTR
jgi:hypothetical protein